MQQLMEFGLFQILKILNCINNENILYMESSIEELTVGNWRGHLFGVL